MPIRSSALLRSALAGIVLCASALTAHAQIKLSFSSGSSSISGDSQDVKDSKNVIAVFTLKGKLSETPADEVANLFGGGDVTSLREMVKNMHEAAHDPNVKAVVLLDEGGTLGVAQLQELRAAMKEIRDAKKEIYVNADSLTMGKFVLFSGASRISVVPTGDVWVTGMFAEQPYLRGLLDKLDVKPDYLHCGAYKSASEMFMRTGPSKEADEMMNWLYDGIYGSFTDLVAQGRNVSADQVRSWIDNGPYTADKAKAAGLIDAVEHRVQFQQMLKDKYGQDLVFAKKYGAKTEPTMDFSSPFAIFKMWGDMVAEASKSKSTKDAVGIVYVDGPIQLGSKEKSLFAASGEGAYSTELRKALDDAASDDSIKAVVLRIDSPGGSATASEIILDATQKVKDKKPLIVSMGNVAGSGGYYVACASDVIFADEGTITGSIGVVGGKFATNGMWDKVGVSFKAYSRGKNAGMLSSASTFSDAERARMQEWMDDIYGVFKKHVTDIRGNRLKKPIDDLAGGRVYTGKQALDLGLVDKIGTLTDAIDYAASQAGIKDKDYDVRVVPEPKSFAEQLFASLTGAGDKNDAKRLLKIGAGASTINLWDLALPQLAGMDPARVAAIRQAFIQMQTMQTEGVTLMTPPVVISN